MTYYGGRELARNARVVRKNTLVIAEEIPEDKYGFKPTPDSRTVAQILSHITLNTRGNHELHALEKVKTFVGLDFAARARQREALERQLQTKAQLLDALRSDGEAWASYLDRISEQELADEITFPQGAEPPSKSRFEMILGVKEHEMHHRAQLMVIQRLLGLAPHLTRQRQTRMAQAPQDKPAGT